MSGDYRELPSVQLAEVWQRESASGKTYFSGYLGAARVLLFDAGERDHPTKPGERIHVWRLVLQQAEPRKPREPAP
jgi:hypothetical protein